ncbi:MAG: M28 family peptidase [Planctomycetes bacterium]|nr:M28 family peptidase [Planctomycetota bacterium]
MSTPSVRTAPFFAFLALCVACDATGAAPEHTAFDAERAWKHLEAQVGFGPRPTGSDALEATRLYLEGQLRAAGLEPKREVFDCPEAPYGAIRVTNLLADIVAPGADAAKLPIVVLATHYDTKKMGFPFVGANDGGSSTAVVLELARVLAERPSSRVVWRMLFLDGEEALRPYWEDPDNRYGSRHHVKALVERGEAKRVKACILLDMVGDANLVLTRDSYSDPRLQQIVTDTAAELGLEKHLGRTPELIKDDHLSFLAEGIPSIDLIDFQYGPANAYWHTRDDTLANCSKESLGVIGKLVLGAVPALEAFATR